MSDKQGLNGQHEPAPRETSGIFQNGQYIAVDLPAPRPIARQLPSVSAVNPRAYVQQSTRGQKSD